jgi:hypothetical protein
MDYAEYLKSPVWKYRARCVRERWGFRCALCNATEPTEVHHRTYDRLGHEGEYDCLPLCAECHTRHHATMERVRREWLKRTGNLQFLPFDAILPSDVDSN